MCAHALPRLVDEIAVYVATGALPCPETDNNITSYTAGNSGESNPRALSVGKDLGGDGVRQGLNCVAHMRRGDYDDWLQVLIWVCLRLLICVHACVCVCLYVYV
jgi:hypothetical protein